MIHDKKKIAALILAKVAPKEKPEADEPETEDGDGLEAAAEELLAAVAAKDAKALAEALRSAFAICGGEETGESDDE